MSIPPWKADRDLSSDDALRTIRAEFPQLDVRRLKHLGSGWEYDVYLADDKWVFRFPRRVEVAELCDRERAILDFIGRRLRHRVQTPIIRFVGGPTPSFPYRFMAHDLIAGVGADDATVNHTAPLAAQLGSILAHLHSTPPTAARAVGIGAENESCLERYEEAVHDVEDLPASGVIVDRAVAWLMSHPAPPPEYDGEPRLLHNDLCPDHMLVRPEDGSLAGLIDWSDAAFGDPTLDFVVLVLWRGWDFVDAVLDAYSPRGDQFFIRRMAFLARVMSLHWLTAAEREQGDVDKHTRWVANAFAADRT